MTEEVAETTEVTETVEQPTEAVAPEGTVETAETPVVEEAPAQPDLSAQFAELQRREKAIRKQQNHIKAQVEAERNAMVEKLKADPMNALAQMGISADDVANAMLSPGQTAESLAPAPATDPAIQQQLEELKAYQQQQLVAEYKKRVFDVVESKPDDFELLLSSEQGRDAYYNAAAQYVRDYGDEPDYSEIAKGVEQALEAQAKKWMSAKKFAAAKASAEPKAPKAESAPESKASDFKTLSNKLVPDQFSSQNRVKVSPVNSAVRSAQSEYAQYMEQTKQRVLDKLMNS